MDQLPYSAQIIDGAVAEVVQAKVNGAGCQVKILAIGDLRVCVSNEVNVGVGSKVRLTGNCRIRIDGVWHDIACLVMPPQKAVAGALSIIALALCAFFLFMIVRGLTAVFASQSMSGTLYSISSCFVGAIAAAWGVERCTFWVPGRYGIWREGSGASAASTLAPQPLTQPDEMHSIARSPQ